MRCSQEAPEKRQEVEEPVKWELGRVARRKRWPPRDDEEVLTPFSAEVEAEWKKPRTNNMSVDEDAAGIDMVYVLPMSFKATTSQEDVDEHTSDDDGLPVAELQLTERRVEAKVVVDGGRWSTSCPPPS